MHVHAGPAARQTLERLEALRRHVAGRPPVFIQVPASAHRALAQGVRAGRQHRESHLHRASAQGVRAGRQHRESGRGISTGHQHRASGRGPSRAAASRATALPPCWREKHRRACERRACYARPQPPAGAERLWARSACIERSPSTAAHANGGRREAVGSGWARVRRQ
jgi:hypothetical protein